MQKSKFIQLLSLGLLLVVMFPWWTKPAYTQSDWDADELEIITAENVDNLTLLTTIDLHDAIATEMFGFYDGSTLNIVALADQQLILLKLGDPQIKRQIFKSFGEDDSIWDIELSPGEDLVAVALPDSGVEVWSLDEGVQVGIIEKHAPYYGYFSVTFNPQTGRVVTGLVEKVAEWDLTQSSETQVLDVGAGFIADIAFDPTGNIMAVAHGMGIVIVDWQTQELTDSVTGRTSNKVLFNSEGTMLGYLTETGDEIGLWNVATQQTIILDETGTGNHYQDIAFNADGSLFVAVALEEDFHPSKIINLYNGYTGKSINTLADFNSEVLGTTFSRDGKFLLVSEIDGNISIWGIYSYNGR
jgi:WD40 repeat protein